MKNVKSIVKAILSLVPLFVWGAQPLQAQTTIIVTTTADDLAVNGNCTLREALVAANTDTAMDGCPAGSDVDTIVLGAGTYTLTLTGPGENHARSGDLDVTSVVGITGAGPAVTIIDGGSFDYPLSDRVIEVATTGSLSASGVSVRGGRCRAGGGILNAGWLYLYDSEVRANIAGDQFEACWYQVTVGAGGGIFNTGRMLVSWSTISGNVTTGSNGDGPGGGVLNRGLATIQYSAITANSAAGGGGIHNTGALQMTTSSIAGNEARFFGGGLQNSGTATISRSTISHNVDGGIVNGQLNGVRGMLSLQNSTVSGNQSYRVPGGVINFAGDVKIASSTIAGNVSTLFGAGVNGPAYLENTIVANAGGDCAQPLVSWGNNLDTDGSCGLNASGDLSGVDPLLGSLANNGGPTLTHALLPGSPAIDHIPAAQCRLWRISTMDQREVARPQPPAGACDIGSYERVPGIEP
jgi:CSLREA domain-containing protein